MSGPPNIAGRYGPTRACLIWCATARWTHGAERDRQLYLTLIHQAKTSEAISYRESQLAARDSATPPPMEA